MRLTYQAKLYLTKQQERKLLEMFYNARMLYNEMLETKINAYKKEKKNVSRFDLQKQFKTKYKELPASVNQMMAYRVNVAYDKFFNKLGKFPRFKSVNRFRSIELRQYEIDYRIVNNKLKVWKQIGNIKMRGFRKTGNFSMGRIVKRASGWYLQYGTEITVKKPIKRIKSAVGIDVGLKSFLIDSNGNEEKPPKFFRKSEYLIRKRQRKVSKAVKGSERKKKKIKILAKTHEYIANQRKDWLHKLSTKYVDKYDLIAVEKLNIKGMLKNHHLAKSIQDSAWDTFTNILAYKTQILGRHFVEVNPRYTSQKCSGCGEIVPKSLSVRTHICPYCNLIVGRDENAAKNILKIALEQGFGEGRT
ncbi:transposase, partial [Patescibacteria group bacterium]|nr:transposase [Patescibacteria group bacterium]